MAMLVKALKLWGAGFIGFITLDLIWIGYVAAGLYRRQIGHVLNLVDGRPVVNVPAALATWAVIVAGIQLFALPRAAGGGAGMAFLWGAVYGLVLYGTYDLTNYSLVKDWPLPITVIDMAWGAVACGTITAGTQLLNRVL